MAYFAQHYLAAACKIWDFFSAKNLSRIYNHFCFNCHKKNMANYCILFKHSIGAAVVFLELFPAPYTVVYWWIFWKHIRVLWII